MNYYRPPDIAFLFFSPLLRIVCRRVAKDMEIVMGTIMIVTEVIIKIMDL